MRTSLGRSLWTLIALFAFSALWAAAPLPDYNVGETPESDVVTPVQLIVIDPERTEALRQVEIRRVPPIFRYQPEAADEAEAQLRAAFAEKRQRFHTLLQTNYSRARLDPATVASSKFQRLVSSFQRQHSPFPLTSGLATGWAQGESDEAILNDWVAKVREVMSRYIRASSLPGDAYKGPGQVRLFTLDSPEALPNLEDIERRGLTVPRADVVSINTLRAELPRMWPEEDQAIVKFLRELVRPNCQFEMELTQKSRDQRTEPIWAADRYEPGQVIAPAGQAVDLKARRALDHLRTRLEAELAKAEAAVAHSNAQATATQLQQRVLLAQSRAESSSLHFRWLLLLTGVLGVFVAGLLWLFGRWRAVPGLLLTPGPSVSPKDPPQLPEHAEQPAEAGAPTGSALAVETEALEPSEVERWKERAILAEQRAARTTAVVRAGLFPHLLEWMKSKLLKGLMLQRAELLAAQCDAERDVAELEQRLARLHAPLEERLRAYEQRIAELQRDLAIKGEENRELIKATIAVTRKKLQAERAKDRLAWN